jgi:hypothetical protein
MLARLLGWLGLSRKPSLYEWMVQQTERHPPRAIAGVLEGDVLIEGHARAGDTVIEAPITGISVIGFRVTIDAHDSLDRQRRVVDWSQVVDFVVEDATGRALVRTAGCKMLLNLEYSSDGSDGLTPPQVLALVNRVGRVDWSRSAPRHFSWTERYLEPGEPVFIFGRARQEIDPTREPGYRQSATRVVLERPEGGALFFSDQRRDDFLRAAHGR